MQLAGDCFLCHARKDTIWGEIAWRFQIRQPETYEELKNEFGIRFTSAILLQTYFVAIYEMVST